MDGWLQPLAVLVIQGINFRARKEVGAPIALLEERLVVMKRDDREIR